MTTEGLGADWLGAAGSWPVPLSETQLGRRPRVQWWTLQRWEGEVGPAGVMAGEGLGKLDSRAWLGVCMPGLQSIYGRTKQKTERWAGAHPSICPSLHPSLHSSVLPSLSPSIRSSLHRPSLHPSLSPSVPPSIPSSIHPSLCPSIPPSSHPPSSHPSILLSTFLSVPPSSPPGTTACNEGSVSGAWLSVLPG